MEQKKSKYDTNPLDPDVARRTDDVWNETGAVGDTATEDVKGATRQAQQTSFEQAREEFSSEAPTRRYDEPNLSQPYASVFVPPPYQPPASLHGGAGNQGDWPGGAPHASAHGLRQPPTSRTIHGINLPENVLMILPYLPFPIVGALIAGAELFLVPRNEPRTRFHAAQGLALHLIVMAVSLLTSTADNFLRGPALVMLTIVSGLFSAAAFIFFIISMIRVWKGEPHVVTPVAELTRWLNEKIEPRK